MKFSEIKSASSKRWLMRQHRDPYVKKAHQDGYRSRAAFKISEIAKKFNIFKGVSRIVELGAAPGGWTQVISQKLNGKLASGEAKMVAVDLLSFIPLPNVYQIVGDFEDDMVKAKIIKYFNGRQANLILSDMAPSTTGHAPTDHLKIMRLAEDAYIFAREFLADGGAFAIKIFHGADEKKFVDELRKNFTKVSYFKPDSSRSMSVEIYVVAMGFKKCQRK